MITQIHFLIFVSANERAGISCSSQNFKHNILNAFSNCLSGPVTDAFFCCANMRYCSTKYSTKVYLPLQLIKDAVDGNWLESLIYYVWIKKLHTKPVIYNHSLRKIGAAIKCSPTTVKTHISVLKKHGLCEISAGNLILKSTRQFAKENKSLVAVGVSNNKADQRNLLRFATIKNNLHSQYKSYVKKDNVLRLLDGQRFSKKETKSLLNFRRRINIENPTNADLTLSNKKFGSICNRSQSTGIKIQKSLNKIGVLLSFNRVEKVATGHNRRSFFELSLDASHFLSKCGTIYKRLSNGLTIPEGVLCS